MEDTLVNPASIVLELPKLIAVVPIVTALFASALFGIFVSNADDITPLVILLALDEKFFVAASCALTGSATLVIV